MISQLKMTVEFILEFIFVSTNASVPHHQNVFWLVVLSDQQLEISYVAGHCRGHFHCLSLNQGNNQVIN